MTAQHRAVEIVSPEFPCGAAWLANCLLELDVRLPDLWGFDTSGEWSIADDGTCVYSATDLPWRQTLASLRVGRTFRFREGVVPRFSHRWPWQVEPTTPVILIVRDPRDALYSEWRRHQRNLGLDPATAFPDFLRQPFFGSPLCVKDLLRVFLSAWIAELRARETAGLVLRFEDWKLDDVEELARVARFLGVDVEGRRLADAAAASRVEILQDVESRLAASRQLAREFNRRGQPGEWKETWEAGWGNLFDHGWQHVFASLSYELPVSTGVSSGTFDPDAVLKWWPGSDAERNRTWSGLLAQWSVPVR